ncbi:hypothetical protein HK102_003989 [Quaeritorhiza haematococci]|nr:hypothetical protein HK102_003989 [Quaeritorhiza haematococci]
MCHSEEVIEVVNFVEGQRTEHEKLPVEIREAQATIERARNSRCEEQDKITGLVGDINREDSQIEGLERQIQELERQREWGRQALLKLINEKEERESVHIPHLQNTHRAALHRNYTGEGGSITGDAEDNLSTPTPTGRRTSGIGCQFHSDSVNPQSNSPISGHQNEDNRRYVEQDDVQSYKGDHDNEDMRGDEVGDDTQGEGEESVGNDEYDKDEKDCGEDGQHGGNMGDDEVGDGEEKVGNDAYDEDEEDHEGNGQNWGDGDGGEGSDFAAGIDQFVNGTAEGEDSADADGAVGDGNHENTHKNSKKRRQGPPSSTTLDSPCATKKPKVCAERSRYIISMTCERHALGEASTETALKEVIKYTMSDGESLSMSEVDEKLQQDFIPTMLNGAKVLGLSQDEPRKLPPDIRMHGPRFRKVKKARNRKPHIIPSLVQLVLILIVNPDFAASTIESYQSEQQTSRSTSNSKNWGEVPPKKLGMFADTKKDISRIGAKLK